MTAHFSGLRAHRTAHAETRLARIRAYLDALLSAETETGVSAAVARPDLDAAIRWHGARLDELLAAR